MDARLEMLRHLRNLLDKASRSAPAGFINALAAVDIKTELMATAVGALPDLLDLAEKALAHEATAPKAEALPDDAPVMEWRVILVETTCKGEFWRGKPQQVIYHLVAESGGDYFSAASVWDREAAGADLPAVRAAATAYSAAKGFRAVFVGEGAGHE